LPIGFHLSGDPFKKYLPLLRQKRAKKIVDLSSFKNRKVIIGAIVKSVKKIKTKKGNQEMAFVNVTDYSGEIEVVVFPKLFLRSGSLWQNNRILLIKALVQEKDNSLVLLADNAVSLSA